MQEVAVKLNKIITLFIMVGCSSVSYDPTLQNIGGNVHSCNMVQVGNEISVNYKKCRNLELATIDIDEISFWYRID